MNELKSLTMGGKTYDSFNDATAIRYEEQTITEEQKAQARENIGVGAEYYSTTREELGEAYTDTNTFQTEYIYSLYDALAEEYPNNVHKNEIQNDDGDFTNCEYVISTRGYTDVSGNDGVYVRAYGNNPPIKKPKYLILSGIHGSERRAVFSTYRFIKDLLDGHNIPSAFREGVVISVMPVGTPSAFNAYQRKSSENVDINRNFGVASPEKETQAIANWLNANSDADLFIDCHNNGALNEKVLILGLPDNSISDTARKIALRGVDRIIPFWRDVIGYPDEIYAGGDIDNGNEPKVVDKDGIIYQKRGIIYSYSATFDVDGVSIVYAQNVIGIPSITLETATFYGDHTDFVVDGKTDSPEAVAMGAEALGNILIEFYAQSCEVLEMSKIDNKLDAIMGQVGNGFRTESGTIVVEEDVIASTGSLTYRIPCTNGAKALAFYADDATMTAIKSTTGTKYVATVLGNCFAPQITNMSGKTRSYMSAMYDIWDSGTHYGWMLNDTSTTVSNTDGFTFGYMAMKEGTYHWKAYYWNE